MPAPDREWFGRRKPLVVWRMKFLDASPQENCGGPQNGEAPRPLVGDYEGSWEVRDRPSFFNRLRRVLG
jgi:hypothetical protein